MSQTLEITRHIRIKYHEHWHTLHFIVLEDCSDDICIDIKEHEDEDLGNSIFSAIKKILGCEPEIGQ
jgi:hypothetical protein